MSLRIVLAASAALAIAAPAFAQDAPPPAPAAAPSSADAPSPEFMAAVARIETAGEAMDGVMADLEPRAAAVRADAALSDADKETRIRAMIAEHQPTLDAFSVALTDLVRMSAMSEGATAEQASAAADAVPARMMAAIEAALITGETEAEDDGEHAGHEGH